MSRFQMNSQRGSRPLLTFTRSCRRFEAFADGGQKHSTAQGRGLLPVQIRIDEVARDLRIGSAGSL